ncbi:MAG: competence/damage-inducible protein A [Verrucomicrobia bacterium]|nr:MAG: competence/damage-inducible protein A [Verrucomicrobiota bacterium]
MNIEIINTGSELLLGVTTNTHLVYLGERLLSLGLRIARQTTVPDNATMRSVLAEAFQRCDILLVTGGLGPTSDDLTREIVADLSGRPLRSDAEIRQRIQQRLARLGIPFRENMLCQTLVPEGAEALYNDHGTAPGLYIPASTMPKAPHIFLFPGPPHELKPMFQNQALPILKRLAGREIAVEQRIFSIIGMDETSVEEKIGRHLLRDGRIEVGYCPRPNEVDFRVIAPSAVLDEVTPQVYAALGEHIASSIGETLEQVVVELLRKRKETLAVAESCTGGLLAHRITNVPGASEVFLEGFITYSNQAKSKTLGVPPSLIESHGAVSKEVAEAMAERARYLTGATHTLSLTGLAGPGGLSCLQPIGTVFITFASQGLPTQTFQNLLLAERQIFKQLATQTALNILRRALLNRGLSELQVKSQG